MKIVFFDIGASEYDASYPLHHPMGGTESAICYLATELARREHAVTIINGSQKSTISCGVEIVPHNAVSQEYFHASAFDAVITTKSLSPDFPIKPLLPPQTQFFLWTGHDVTVPIVQPLGDTNIVELLDGIVMVSEWQRQRFITNFGIPAHKTHVIKNAISPAFENLFADRNDLANAKASSLRLAYTSTPYRGLVILLQMFPYFNAQVPEATLDIYSSMEVYHIASSDNRYTSSNDRHANLYETAKTLQNVVYIGGLNQRDLAKALRRVSILSYPNTFPETSCISVMEAMAAGAYIVTSDLGALTETTSGYGKLISIQGEESENNYAYHYVKALKNVADHIKYKHEAFIEQQYGQVQFANQQLTWKLRASEWERLLTKSS